MGVGSEIETRVASKVRRCHAPAPPVPFEDSFHTYKRLQRLCADFEVQLYRKNSPFLRSNRCREISGIETMEPPPRLFVKSRRRKEIQSGSRLRHGSKDRLDGCGVVLHALQVVAELLQQGY